MRLFRRILKLSLVCCVATLSLQARNSIHLSLHNSLSLMLASPGMASTDTVPFDPGVRKGVLPNGFTYYLRHTDLAKGMLDMHLVINAGNNQQEKNQVEVAHLLEHLAFKGTVHFPNPKNDLESLGLKWGRDIRAMTGGDQTTFSLTSLETDNTKQIDNCLFYFRDISNNIIVTDSTIDKERYVVWNELCRFNDETVYMRDEFMEALIDKATQNYFKRATQRQVMKDGFLPDVLRQFYKYWYRADNQAIIVVGNFDIDWMERKIRTVFSTLLCPSYSLKRRPYTALNSQKNHVIVKSRADIKHSYLQIILKQPTRLKIIQDDYAYYTQAALIGDMIQRRLNKIASVKTSPFIAATNEFRYPFDALTPRIDAFVAMFYLKDGMERQGIKVAFMELQRLLQWGFNQQELTESVDKFNYHSNYTLNDIANQYVNHFANNEGCPGIDEEVALYKTTLSTINLDQINAFTKQIITYNNQDIWVLTPDNIGDKFDSDQVKKIQTDIMKEDFPAFSPPEKPKAVEDDTLQAKVAALNSLHLLKAAPYHTKKTTSLGITELRLANGVSVVLKSLPNNNSAADKMISIQAFNRGETALYKNSDRFVASIATKAVMRSGIGQFNKTDLATLRKKYDVNISMWITNDEEHLSATAPEKSSALLFQLIYLYFTQPRLEQAAFEEVVNSYRPDATDGVSSDKFSAVWDSLRNELGLHQNMVINSPRTDVNIETARKVFKERFGDPSHFTFVITGNFDAEQLIPLLNKYMGSLKSSVEPVPSKKSVFKQLKNLDIRKIIYTERGSKLSHLNVCFAGSCELNLQNKLTMQMVNSTLETILHHRIREVEGATYALFTFLNIQPSGVYSIDVTFDCAPEVASKITDCVWQEIEGLQKNELDTQLLATIKTKVQAQLNLDIATPSFWEEYIVNQIRTNRPLAELEEAEKIINRFTPKDLRQGLRKYISRERHYELIGIPEGVNLSLKK